jgi:cell division septation protein DedD
VTRAAGAALLLLGLITLATAAHAAPTADESALRGILAQAPSGTPATRAAWLYERARQLPDARLALRLLDEIPARAPAEWHTLARLWRVRYWMATDSVRQAIAELDRLGDLPASSPAFAEAAYWREVSGLVHPRETRGRAASFWDALADIAALGNASREAPDLRRALSLEGEMRRFGLLGPWLWQLTQSETPAVRRTARDILRLAARELAHAPETALWTQEMAGRGEPDDGAAIPVGAQPPLAAGAADTLVPVDVTGPAVPAAAASAASVRYGIEVGLLDDEATAERLTRELGSHGFEARVARTQAATGGVRYRVFLGPCASPAAAESLGATLHRALLLPYRVVEVP